MDQGTFNSVWDWFSEVIAKIGEGVLTLIEALPPIVLGIIVGVIFLLYLFRKAHRG